MEPSSFLVENLALLPRGKALDVAMGEGRNAVFLAKQGFSVEGVDIAEDSVRRALTEAQRESVTIQAVAADLEGGYRIARGAYDLIICFNYLQRSLAASMQSGLRAGGFLVYETYIVEQAELFGRPHNPAFLLKHNELLAMFRGLRVLLYREGVLEDRAVAAVIAQKERPQSHLAPAGRS